MNQLYAGNAMDILRRDIGAFDAIIKGGRRPTNEANEALAEVYPRRPARAGAGDNCDPPYASGSTLSGKQSATSVKYTSTKKKSPYPDFCGDGMDQRAWTHMMRQVLEAAREKASTGAALALFIDWRNLPALTDAAEGGRRPTNEANAGIGRSVPATARKGWGGRIIQWAGWFIRGVAVWDKINSRPQRGRFRQQTEFIVWGSNGDMPADRGVPCLPGVFRATNVQGDERIHQTQKPLDVMREVVKICAPGGRILDPFAGSGSTLAAAALEGYDAVGIELHKGIAQAAAERLGIEVIL